MLFGIIVLCRLVFCDDVLQLLFPKCSPNVPQILNEQAIAAGKLWLDIPGAAAIMEIKRALRQAVQPEMVLLDISLMSTKPSLGRVAVLLFYSDRHGKSEDMQRQNNRHRRHLLSEGVAEPPAV